MRILRVPLFARRRRRGVPAGAGELVRRGRRVTGALTWALVISALAVVVVRRRSVAIALVAVQSLVARACTRSAVASGHSTALLVAGAVLLAKARGARRRCWRSSCCRTREPRLDRAPSAARWCGWRSRSRSRSPIAGWSRGSGCSQPGVERAAVGAGRVGHHDRDRAPPGALPGARVPRCRERPLPRARSPRPAGCRRSIELGLVFDLVLIVSVAAVFSDEDPRGARHRRHARCSEACVTDALAIAVPALPVAAALLIQLAAHPAGGGPRQHRAARSSTAAVGARRCAVVALDAQRDADRTARGISLDGATGVLSRASIAVVGLLSALVSPAYLADHGHGLFRAHALARLVLPRASTCSGRRCSRCR